MNANANAVLMFMRMHGWILGANASPGAPREISSQQRQLRAAAVLSFRNGRYDDSCIQGEQSLSLFAAQNAEADLAQLPEILLLCREGFDTIVGDSVKAIFWIFRVK